MACKAGHFETRPGNYINKALTDVIWSCNKCMEKLVIGEVTHMIAQVRNVGYGVLEDKNMKCVRVVTRPAKETNPEYKLYSIDNCGEYRLENNIQDHVKCKECNKSF